MKKIDLTEENIKKLPQTPGVYTIFVQKNFRRLRGSTRIVYIGKGNKLRTRLLKLRRNRGHVAGPRIKLLEQKNFQLSFEVVHSASAGMAKRSETKKLREYKDKHLELPPLNHKE